MQEINKETDNQRLQFNKTLDPINRSALGQYFTPGNIAMFMASLFSDIDGDVKLLEPGVGIGSLIAAFVNEASRRKKIKSLNVESYDVEETLVPILKNTISKCEKVATNEGFNFSHTFNLKDFISDAVHDIITFEKKQFTHVLLNPPYKKINSTGLHRLALKKIGVETVNLYSAFVALSIELLEDNGELVAIIPRSFCNGAYYQSFRELILRSGSIKHIHIFDSRSKAFEGDDVLQENIIIHYVKGVSAQHTTITSSPSADFQIDEASNSVVATDMTLRKIEYSKMVQPNDKHSFIHIAATNREQDIIDRLSNFSTAIDELDIKVSTGPVVDFRHQDDWTSDSEQGSFPLLYPHHFTGKFNWPKQTKKTNSIRLSNRTKSFLWRNNGYYLIVKRFSSKEEKHRIMAFVYDSSLPGEYIGFENKLNVFHTNKEGLTEGVAKGLFVYLNSSLVDKYYRQFGGHTQVNATDLKAINYPSRSALERIGKKVTNYYIPQTEIDRILDDEIECSELKITKNPLMGHKKIEEALKLLLKLGMPKQQLNERSALTLLALLNLTPEDIWSNSERPMVGVTPIMDWIDKIYGKAYAPNTREAFRRQTLHQFISAGIVLYNPDKPERPVNSPKACYQITPELHSLIVAFEQENWDLKLAHYLKDRTTLVKKYAMAREMTRIPVQVKEGTDIYLTAGIHSELIKAIIVEFGPLFAPGADVIYIGDTGAKSGYFQKDLLRELGVVVDSHGKMPDVVLYCKIRNWMFLIESVTSHGPVDGKRHAELQELFSSSTAGLVYVTAFPSKKTLKEYLDVMAWETEVWFADSPTHLMHLNGDRFLGPHL